MKLFGLFLSFTLLFLCPFISQADVPELSRQPPRPIVFVHNDRSKSDPQQVLLFISLSQQLLIIFHLSQNCSLVFLIPSIIIFCLLRNVKCMVLN